MTNRKLLVVDDEKTVCENIRRFLAPRDFSVSVAYDGSSGYAIAGEVRPDLVVSDVDMPDMDGFQLCRLLKKGAATRAIPVILMTGKAVDERSIVTGLGSGADDYVLKPFSLPVLEARIQAVLRRKAPPGPVAEVLKRDGIEVDTAKRIATVRGKRVKLTRKEFDLLGAFLASGGRVLTPQALLRDIWGYDLESYNDPHTVEVHVSNLRRKLGKELGKKLVRVTGMGYRLED